MAFRGPLRDKSGTITTGGTAQGVATADTGRRFFYFQNLSDTIMYVNFGTTAVAGEPSIAVEPLAATAVSNVLSFTGFVPTDLVSVMCATTGKAYTCKVG